VNPQVMWWLVAVIVWAALTISLHRLRRWLLFYLIGAFGFVLLIAYGAGALDIDTLIESVEATQVAAIAGLLGIGVEVVEATGLAIPNHTGWAVFDIGLECSAILEMAAIVGLTAFYPAFRPGKRALFGVTGMVLTYVINIGRILLIVAIINAFGTDWVFAAHAVFGRVFFFIGTVALYWYLMTRPTIGFTRKRIEEGAAS
jgi:exosortase family protein XrtG